MGRRDAGEVPEWDLPRHRNFSPFRDESVPNVVLMVGEGGAAIPAGAEEAGYTPQTNVAARAVVTAEQLPENYFAPVQERKTYLHDVILECLELGASDMLIDSTPDEMLIRARVDGRMRPIRQVKGIEARAIMNIFKSTTSLSTTTSFKPQEATYNLQVGEEVYPVRVVAFRREGALESAVGDAIALRLPQTGPVLTLEELGFSDMNLSLFQSMLDTGNKMIMIAGPMGAGKSTTAQAATMYVAGHEKSVWSVEDPIERVIPGLIQLSVNEDQGADFDDLLSFLLRADYDTLFLGEIRNPKTAAAGVRQAKAGRQVITTIHANNNVTALLRLIDLANDSPLSVLDSVRGVVSQRLVSRLNPDWKEGDSPAAKYRGRVPIHEVLTVDDVMIEAIMSGAPLREIKRLATATSASTFALDLERLVQAGITDEQEAQRILRAN